MQQHRHEEATMKKTNLTEMSRRRMLQGTAGLAGMASMGLPSLARAQAAGTVVVGTWGGDYARLLNKNIEEPILIPAGWEVIQDQAGDPERRAKMAAERRLPRGTTDLQGLSAVNMYQVFAQGLTQEIDYSRLKNGGEVLETLKYPFGVAPGYGGTQRLPRLVGSAAALHLILTGDMIDAAEAYRIGLVHRVVPAGDLMAEAERLVRRIAAQAPLAVRLALEAVIRGRDMPLEQGLLLEANHFGLLTATADMKEGLAAFLAKRPPRFGGR
jgi:hypothetical protein